MTTPMSMPGSRKRGSHGSFDADEFGSLGTNYFMKSSLVKRSPSPPLSPQTKKKLLRVRKMNSSQPSTTTIPTEVSDVSIDWACLLVNQHRLKHGLCTITPTKITKFDVRVDDCMKSAGDLSSTCRIITLVRIEEEDFHYSFIAKLLPPDDPCRLYVFESNVFEKEISIYFEFLPSMRQFVMKHSDLELLLTENIPTCIYGSNDGNGAGVLVFECAQEKGYLHTVDPEGLSLSQVRCTVSLIAKFHAIGSAMLIKKGKDIKLRYPYLVKKMESSNEQVAAASNMFDICSSFIGSIPGHSALHQKFAALKGTDAARTMFSCMRRQINSPLNTIIHGELWEKNLLYRHGDSSTDDDLSCVILDWKNAKIASATKDLAFLVLSSTNNLLRTESLSDFLHLYYSTFVATLTQLGVDLGDHTYEDFYEDYRLSMKGAFLQAICVLVQEMTYLETQLSCGHHRVSLGCQTSPHNYGDMLRAFEERTLTLMNDAVSLEIL